MTEVWLLADVGGSNTRLGLARSGKLIEASRGSLPNARFNGLAPMLRHYLDSRHAGPVAALCAGVAGPVRDGAAQLTNHDWFINVATLRRVTGAGHVRLINDIQAQGYALDDLPEQHVSLLFPGASPPPCATRLVMGIGTGSNVAVVHRTGRTLFVPPAESGHAGLPFADGELGELIDHLGTVEPHRPMESALSGRGIEAIWRWLGGTERSAAKIVAAAHAGDVRADRALALFARLLGQVTGDLALAHLPTGGLYLFGGVARAIAPFLDRSDFYVSFTRKGPYRAILADIPVLLITDDSAGLRGCARVLRQDAAA